jgi:tetratricopeptide (TPR) repeat protein
MLCVSRGCLETSLGRSGYVLCEDQGKLDEAEKMYELALLGYDKALGPEHKSTLDAVNNLGILYWVQGKLDEAEKMYERALLGYEKALGPEHKSTLDTVDNLGILYWVQGKLDKAEKMYERSLLGYKKVYGYDHPHCETLRNTLNHLARLKSKWYSLLRKLVFR